MRLGRVAPRVLRPSRLTTRCRAPRHPCGEKMGEAAQIPPWPRRKRSQPLPCTHRTGNHGIAWDFMGVNGKTREQYHRRWENFREGGAIRLHFALTIARLPARSEARYNGKRTGIGAEPTGIRDGAARSAPVREPASPPRLRRSPIATDG